MRKGVKRIRRVSLGELDNFFKLDFFSVLDILYNILDFFIKNIQIPFPIPLFISLRIGTQ